MTRTRQVLTQIEQLQHELIEAERSHHHQSATFDKIERQVNNLTSDVEMVRAQASDLCSKSEQYSRVVETELRTVITNFEDLNRRLNLAQERRTVTPPPPPAQQEQHMTTTTTTVTTNNTSRQSKHEAKYTRQRQRTKSPSESSVDSSADVFDSELRQKYMRAVAYLRILDETPLVENDDQDAQDYGTETTTATTVRHREHQHQQHTGSSIDIDLVIEQARNIAYLNEKTNPERSQRILEKVHKLEQRWAATKSKRDSLRSSSKLYDQYKRKEGHLGEQIHILEKHFATYRIEDTAVVDDDDDEGGAESEWVSLINGIFLYFVSFFEFFFSLSQSLLFPVLTKKCFWVWGFFLKRITHISLLIQVK